MAPFSRPRHNRSKRITISSLADIAGDLALDSSPTSPQAPWVIPAQQRYQFEDDSDTGYNPRRRPPPTQARRGVGPRGPQPANASPTSAGRAAAPIFRLSMFKGGDQPGNNAFADPEYGPLDDPFAETQPRGFGRQRDDPQAPIGQGWGEVARDRARQIEQQIIGFLEGGPTAPVTTTQQEADVPPVPIKFREKIIRAAETGQMRPAVRDYYLDLRRRDVRGIPGQDGAPSLVQEILARDADDRLRGRQGVGWRPTRTLGTGGQGKVILWEKVREGGEPIRLATKDMAMTSLWFQDYNSEGHLTRRLNETGCLNVIKVLEWAYLEPKPMPLHDMSLITLPEEPKFRIAYEVADHGDLYHVVKWYKEHNLIFPEAFMWHIFYSIANALCYCALGRNDGPVRAEGWEEIVHGDLKPENVLLTDPEEGPAGLYPTAKLADFGLAYTVGNEAVRRYKAAFSYGTRGYMAPEVEAIYNYNHDRYTPRPPHLLPGPHTDIYSLGRTLDDLLSPTQEHYPSSTLVDIFSPIPAMFAPPSPAASLHSPYIYTADLIYWMNRCLNDAPAHRPGIWELLVAVRQKAQEWRRAAVREESEARSRGRSCGVFHSRVLWRREDRCAFETDNSFRAAYRNANLGPLWERLAVANQRAAGEGRGEGAVATTSVSVPGGGKGSAELFYEAVVGGEELRLLSEDARREKEGDAFWRLL